MRVFFRNTTPMMWRVRGIGLKWRHLEKAVAFVQVKDDVGRGQEAQDGEDRYLKRLKK